MKDWENSLRRAREGDLESFAQVVREFQSMAVGYAYSLLGDFHLAEDAAQEAFITAYRNLRSLESCRAFPAWFRKIVFTACHRMLRKQEIRTVELSDAAEAPSSVPGPLQSSRDREIEDRVMQAIRNLPEHERAVASLVFMDRYSYAEVAGFLEVPVSTVKSRLHSARKKLREKLAEEAAVYFRMAAAASSFAGEGHGKRGAAKMEERIRDILKSWDVAVAGIESAGADFWKIVVGKGRSPLRLEIRGGIDDTGDIEGRCVFLATLSERGLPVPPPLPTKKGPYCAVGGDRVFTLRRCESGEEVHYDVGSPARARGTGRTLGKLHEAMKGIDVDCRFRHMSLESQIQDWALPRTVEIARTRHFRHTVQALETLRAELSERCDPLPIQVIHRDFGFHQLLFDGEEISGIKGWFDMATLGYRIFDICYACTGTLEANFDDSQGRNTWPGFVAALVGGYESVSSLSKDERGAIWYVMLAVQCIFVAFWRDHHGDEELAARNLRILAWIYENKAPIRKACSQAGSGD